MDKAGADKDGPDDPPVDRSPAIYDEGPPGAGFEDEKELDDQTKGAGFKRLIASIAPYEPGDLRNVMRQQFIMSIEVERLFSANPGDDDRREAVNEALDNALLDRNSWRSGYCAEQLMVGLMDEDKLIIDTERRLLSAENNHLSAAARFSAEFTEIKQEKPIDQNRLRYLLLRIISDSQWRRMRSWLERRFAAAYVSRINRIWMACIVVFMFSVFIADILPDFKPSEPTVTSEKIGKGGDTAPVVAPDVPALTGGDPALSGKPVAAPKDPKTDQFLNQRALYETPELHKLSGLILALITGLLGAAFSMIAMAQRRLKKITLEELQLQSRWEFLILRLGFGSGAAVILYFAFQSGLMTGALFPNITQLGVVENKPVDGQQWAAWVPNADLAGLMVWSFIAGFSENFVPNFLNKADGIEADFKH